jgi:hypothetical protein
MNTKYKLLRGFSFIALFIMFGCPGGSPTEPEPPCSIAKICVLTEKKGATCCDGLWAKWTISNSNPSRGIWAIVVKEENEYGKWVQKGSAKWMYLPPNNVLQELECESTSTNPEFCNSYRRYLIADACFSDDTSCKPRTPNNPDLPSFDCLQDYKQNKPTCIVVDFSTLNNVQKNAINELRYGLQAATDFPYIFPKDLLEKAFLSSNANCSGRISILSNSRFENSGRSCRGGISLPKPVTINGTNRQFSNLWISFPSLIKSLDFIRLRNETTMKMDYIDGDTIWIKVTVDGMPAEKPREDLITKIQILGEPREELGTLIVSGKDFFCLVVKDIPRLP